MREIWAGRIAVLTALLVVLLAVLFARAQRGAGRPGASPAAPGGLAPDPALVDVGRRVYEREGCSVCHSIGGVGNPRSPLDGVADRRGPEAVRAWILAEGEAEPLLPPRVVQAKKASGEECTREEIEALVAYLRSLASTLPGADAPGAGGR